MIKLTVQLPDLSTLPDGSHRRLLEAVHRLYRLAGMPGVRRISDGIRERDDLRDTVSPETVSNILNGTSVPKWSKLEPVARILQDWSSDKRESEGSVARIRSLWLDTQELATPLSEPRETVQMESAPRLNEARSSVHLTHPPGLIVENEEVNLRYVNNRYEYNVERVLYNDGETPLHHFDIKIAVDRFPGNPARSAEHHESYPLMWDEIAFEAFCDNRPVDWLPTDISPKIKIVRLRFGNDDESFPLKPGRKCRLKYGCTLSDAQWGRWLQRSIRLKTRSLVIAVDLPENPQPVAWSLTKDPDGTPSYRSRRQPKTVNGRSTFVWQPHQVKEGFIYRIEWSFAAPHARTL